MENFAADLVSLLQYLLPGFLSAWIFYGFTSFQKPSQFERVVQALIFTLVVQAGLAVIYWFGTHLGKVQLDLTKESELLSSVFLAIAIGFLFAFFANTDRFHALVRKLRITKETSYPSEWYGEFSKRVTYVVLHLSGERRIYGWPREWPSSPESGHFSLEQASWLTLENEEIALNDVEAVMIPVKDVTLVEFMRRPEEE